MSTPSVIRRDPRLAWIARNRLHPRYREVSTATETLRGPSGLIRKNPHTVGFIGANGIKRIDRLGGNSAQAVLQRLTGKEKTAESLPLVKIENPEFYIVAVLEMVGGRLSDHDRDVLGQAHQLIKETGCEAAVVAVVFGESKEQAFNCAGVDRLIHLDADTYRVYNPELQVAALMDIETSLQPRYWLFPDSIHGGADLGLRLSAMLAERPATQAWKVDINNTVCRGGSNRVDFTRETPRILLLAQECANPVDETRHEVKVMDVIIRGEIKNHIHDNGLLAVDANQVPLAEAEFIISAGNGVKDWSQFHLAAQTLAATEGASRVVVDNGFMPRSRQVGATGAWVTAQVYLAVGISGAVQHMQGIGQCEKVIAINLDAGCDMVKRADLSVIGDAQEILSQLMILVRAYRSGEVDHAA
jgi:N,N-dimethylglycine/sarcosine catabolism electron transfer flavoprotein subunit alpha